MRPENLSRVKALLEKGVRIAAPESIEIGPEVDLDRISAPGVSLYSGTKIYGKSTLILDNAKIGYEGPVTIQDCQIGPQVELKGGFFKGAVFLRGANMGLGAHIRDGCILEEEANGAHTVALKQTILFPFVTLGSLINFCDCFMAGGTSRKDHSEVGSSYIHFNYTPNQDKATPSLIGDVPEGVMLDQAPIFLGGQGGLVGPCRIAFGSVLAAGTICRKDQLRSGRLVIGGGGKGGSIPFSPGVYGHISRIVKNNLVYLGNLFALNQWYRQVRRQFIGPEFPVALHKALIEKVELAINERIKRLAGLAQKMMRSVEILERKSDGGPIPRVLQQQKALAENWVAIGTGLGRLKESEGSIEIRDRFLTRLGATGFENERDYIRTIQGMTSQQRELGRSWLQGIVASTTDSIAKIVPSLLA